MEDPGNASYWANMRIALHLPPEQEDSTWAATHVSDNKQGGRDDTCADASGLLHTLRVSQQTNTFFYSQLA